MKKLNLEKLGVVELNDVEKAEVFGGSWFFRHWKEIGMVATAIAAAVLYVVEEVF